MSAPDLLETLQQRLQSPLSDSQLESLAELIEADPKKFDAVMDEIRTQGIEIIPISLSPDDELDELVEWLIQLASTRNVGRGFNAVIVSTAVILLIAAIGIGVTFFEFPSVDNPDPTNTPSEEITKVPRQQIDDPTERNPVQKPADPDTEEEGDSTGSTPVTQENPGLVLPELPITPQWLAFDDPAARLDHSWVKSLPSYIRQPLEKPGKLIPGVVDGMTQYFDLDGDFLLPPPRDDGSSLRVRLSNIEDMTVTVDNGEQKIELTYDGNFNLTRYESLPVKEFVRRLAIDSEPRFRRHFIESRVDPQINFDWGLASPVVNQQVVDPDYFAVQWKGFIVIPANGRYVFNIVADDGVRLRINGVEVIDSWSVQPEIELSGAIDLTAGTFPIEVEFFSDRMTARIALAWESEDLPKQIIGSDSLRSSVGPEGLPGLTGHYCYGPFVEAVETPVEQAVDLVDNDNGRWRGFMGAGFDLRFQNKTFVVSRGDIPLTHLPMETPPATLKIQTKARLQYLDPIRLEPIGGLADVDDAGIAWQPASEFPWYVLTDSPDSGGTYKVGEQGEVQLTRTAGSNPVHLQTNVSIQGSTDIYALMKNPTHLTGIRFQHPQSDMFYSLYFLKMGNSYVVSMNPTDLVFTSDQYRAGARVNNQVWWRAHYGDSHFIISMSPNGKHWKVIHSLPLDAALPRKREVVFGLTTVLGDEQATVSVDKVCVKTDRLIEQLSTFLPVGNVANIPQLKQATRDTQKITDVVSELVDQRPETISSEEWRLACYARALEINLTPTMRQEVLVRLLHHAVLYHPDVARVYKALVTFPQRLQIRRADGYLHSWQNLQYLFDLLASRLWIENKSDQLKLLIDEWLMLRAGLGGRERYELIPVTPELLTRLYLYHLRNRGRWQELYGFTTKIQYLSLSPHGNNLADKEFSAWRIAHWLQGESADMLEQLQQPVIKPADATRFSIQRPASVETDRESVNAMREILQAVTAEDLDNATKMITSNPIPAGLFPVDSLGVHFQSGNVYLRAILENNSKLAEKLKRDSADLADLRLKKSIDSIDMEGVAQIAMRFRGTPASVEAIELLANHQLSTGLFLSAAQNFDDLIKHSTNGSTTLWDAKRKLALALSGQKSPAGVESDVKLEGEMIAKDQFNALLDQLVAQRGRQYVKPSKQNLSPKNRTIVPLLDMSLPGSVRSDARRTRQVSFMDLGNTLLINQPARLTCYSPSSKQVVWKIEDSGQDMPAEYMYNGQPVLFGNGVFVSVFKEKSFYWTLLNPVDGKPLWETPAVGIPFADPVVAGSSIYVLAVTQQKTTFGHLTLQQLDSTTGELVSNTVLMNVQIDGDLFRRGRSTLTQDHIVFTLEGVIYSTSLQGDLRWAQRLERVPKIADEYLYNNVIVTAPVVIEDRIFLYAEGSAVLVCLDCMTGNLLWKYRRPGLQKVVGIYDDQIVLVGQSGIESLQWQDGVVRWFHPVSVNPHSVLIHNDHILALVLDKPLATTQLALQSERGMLWLHPQTGNVEHYFTLQEENKVFFDVEQIFTFNDQMIAVGNVDVNARTFKLMGLPVK